MLKQMVRSGGARRKDQFDVVSFRLNEAEVLAQQGLDVATKMRNQIDIPDETRILH